MSKQNKLVNDGKLAGSRSSCKTKEQENILFLHESKVSEDGIC